MSEGLEVYKAITRVTAGLNKEGIGKTRKNQQKGYSFRGIDDIYNALSSHLSDAQMCIIPRVISRSMIERQARSGTPLFHAVVEVEFDLISAIDGSKHVARVIGEAMDTDDKATNKAMSAAYKYMAMQTFTIPTEGDNDADQHSYSVASSSVTAPLPPYPDDRFATNLPVWQRIIAEGKHTPEEIIAIASRKGTLSEEQKSVIYGAVEQKA